MCGVPAVLLWVLTVRPVLAPLMLTSPLSAPTPVQARPARWSSLVSWASELDPQQRTPGQHPACNACHRAAAPRAASRLSGCPSPPPAACSQLGPLCHAGFGAAYGTAKSGVGIASMGVMRPELVMKVRRAAGSKQGACVPRQPALSAPLSSTTHPHAGLFAVGCNAGSADSVQDGF